MLIPVKFSEDNTRTRHQCITLNSFEHDYIQCEKKKGRIIRISVKCCKKCGLKKKCKQYQVARSRSLLEKGILM